MKEKFYKNKKVLIGAIAGLLIIVIVLSVCLRNRKPEEISEEEKLHGVKSHIDIMDQSDERIVDIEAIVQENEKQIITEKIEMAETDVEYTTQYRENNSLASRKNTNNTKWTSRKTKLNYESYISKWRRFYYS